MLNKINYKISDFTNFIDHYSNQHVEKIYYMSDLVNKQITYKKLIIIIKNFNILIKKYKIKQQDKIMVISDNGEDLVMVYLSILYHKLIFVPVNPNVVKSEFIYLKNKTKPKLFITNKFNSKKLGIKKTYF